VLFASLWNDGKFFEAHEALEALWIRTRDREQQGLIQAAVALHHLRRGNVRGARKMIDRALSRLPESAVARYCRIVRDGLERLSSDELIARRPRL